MKNRNERSASDITRKMILVQLVGVPGTIMVGLALYGIFAADGNAFWAPLNDTRVTYNMLGIGAVIMAWESFQVVKLARLKQSLVDHRRSD